VNQRCRTRSVAIADRRVDRRVLLPDGLAQFGMLDHLAHRAPQMVPELTHHVDEERVAGDVVHVHMKRHVGVDQSADRARSERLAAGREQRIAAREVGGGGIRRRERRCIGLERLAQLVDRAQERGFKRCDTQPAPACIDQQALLFQKHQRLPHRLPRHREHRRDRVLREPRARLELAVADRVENRRVDLVGDRRCGSEGFHSDSDCS